MTTFDEYDRTARGTDISPRTIEYYMIGLSGEVGETCNEFKKVLRDKEQTVDEESRRKMLDELGDTLWYLSRLVACLGSTLDEVALRNLTKLHERHNK